MKNKLIALLVFAAALILPLTNADAATYRWKRMPLNNFISVYPSNMKINGYSMVIGSHGGYRTIEAHVIEDGNNIYHGYCLHVGKEIYSDSAVGLHEGFGDLVGSDGNPIDETRQTVLKNILASGYQNGNRTIDNFVSGDYVHHNNTVGTCVNTEICTKVLATQLLVWEVQAGARSDYDINPKGNAEYNSFVNDNINLKNAYTNILNAANELTRTDNFPAANKTVILHWSDSENKYVSKEVSLGDYNIDTSSLPENVSVTNKSEKNTVIVSSNKTINNESNINVFLKKGSTTTTSETFRWYRFLEHSDAQDVLMGDYSITLKNNFKVKTESGSFRISKIDAETKKILKGAKFELYKCNESNCSGRTKIADIDLTKKAKDVEVKVNKSGRYILKEVVAPYGYTSLDEFTFDISIGEDGKANLVGRSLNASIYIRENSDGDIVKHNIVVEDKPKVINIKKVTLNNKDETAVDGATFQVKDKDGNIVKFTKDSTGIYRYDKDGKVTDIVESDKSLYRLALLPSGEYTVVETSVPYPYVLAGKVEDRQTKIKIDKNSDLFIYNTKTKKYEKSSTATIKVKNFKTRVEIIKEGISGTLLPGVTFELYDSTKTKQIPLILNSKTGEYEAPEIGGTPIQIVTNSAGKAVINYLEPGTYYLKETKTLDGYEITKENEWTKIDVVVGRDSAPIVIKRISNAKGEFSFYKIDEDGNYLGDGKFKLQVYNEKKSIYEDVALVYHEKENYYTIDKTGKSDIYIFTPANGIATFKEIDAKTKYRIVEIEAPEGFVLPKESETYVDLVVSENGYVSGNPILINKKVTVEEEASAQAELVINISTGQDRIRYALIIGGILTILIVLFILKGKLKK